MAVLALGVAGAAIGSTLGYASAGWLVGTMLGNMLGGKNKPQQIVQEGPRINDTRVQSSAWGSFIPIGFGDFRAAGNIIWASRIREIQHATTERQGGGGKGGGGGGGGTEVTYISYTTEVDLAIGLCEGPIDGIRRIWGNGKLIYDVGVGASTDTIISSNRSAAGFIVYPGNETQLPDPTIEAAQGVGNVSAHRGLAYVVFNSFQLQPFGGSAPPNFTFEIIKSGTTALLQIPTTWSGGIGGGAVLDAKWNLSGAIFTYGASGVSTWSPVNGTLIGSVNYVATGMLGFTVNSWQEFGFAPRGDGTMFAIAAAGLNGVGLTTITRLDEQGVPVRVWYAGTSSFTLGARQLAYGGDRWFYYNDTSTGRVYGFSESANALVNPSAPVTTHVSLLSNTATDGLATGWFGQSRGGRVGFLLLVPASHYRVAFPNNGTLNSKPLGGVSPVSSSVSVGTAPGVVWDHLGNPWVNWQHSTPSAHPELHQLNPDTGDVVRSIVLPNGPVTQASLFFFSVDGYVYHFDGSTWYKRDYATGALIHTSVALPNTATVIPTDWANIVQISDGGTTQTALAIIEPLPRFTVTTSTTWADAATALCARVGLTTSDINVAALTDNLPGYMVGRAGTARAALEPLCRAFFTDVVESDDVLKFVKRGGTSIATIPYRDLVVKNGSKPLEIMRLQEQELPRQITFIYFNKDGDYIQASEYSRRLVTRSKSDPIEEIAIAMSPSTAVQTVEKWLYDAYVRRNSFKFFTTRKYAEYEPTDTITVTGPTSSYIVQLMNKTDLGTTIEWEAIASDAPIYTSAAVSGTVQEVDAVIALPGPTRLDFLDIPILRDTDNVPGFYAPLSGYTSAWRGSTLLGSDDGQNFTEHGSAINSATVGNATTVLANFPGANATFDEGAGVTVALTAGGPLSTITRTQALTLRYNVALLGDEIIVFRDAVLQSGTTYKLTGLIRGRRGTEMFMGTHAVGDRFVLLSVAGIIRVQLTLEQVNAIRHYRASSFGESAGSSPTRTFTSTGALLRPLPPCRVVGFRHQPATNDWLIKWTRRGRLAANWLPSIDVPLGEDSEAYSIDVYNAAGTTVMGTLSATTQNVTYLAADQVTHFGSVQTSLKVRIYQISAQVGRGFPTAVTSLT